MGYKLVTQFHVQLITSINRRFVEELKAQGLNDYEIAPLSIISGNTVNMANLYVNSVRKIA